MGFLITATIILVVLGLLILKFKGSENRPDDYPYVKNATLFTPAERSLLGVLEQAVGEDFRIFGKVRVVDVVSVRSMSNRSAYQRALNKITSKHFDFILCNKDDLSILGAIELNDRSHQQTKRQERDSFLERVCKVASLPFIQLQARRGYSIIELRDTVRRALGGMDGRMTNLARPDGRPKETEPVGTLASDTHADSTNHKIDYGKTDLEAPRCPKCSARMVRRETKKGANAGELFWGCSTFPKCRSIVPLSPSDRAGI
jgi:Protein of unknown function (DUF2726)/Topoisomerase DNA binding C4 zinc finger